MSLFGKRSINFLGADQLIPHRSSVGANAWRNVSDAQALRVSTVWACLRLRADLVSSMPVDVYRRVGDQQFEVTPPPVLVNPGGTTGGIQEWLYASQFDLDRYGNCYGVITARDRQGRPARIELQQGATVTIKGRGSTITEYRIGNETYDPLDVWHERQFVTAGVPVGLSPIAYAALAINEHANAQEFIASWFGGSAVPKARMKNIQKTVSAPDAQAIRDRYEATVSNGGLFVHGADWEFDTLQANAADKAFIDALNASNADVCRYLGVPADLVDVNINQGGRSTITYANITQRNLQLLILNLGPAVARREHALSSLTALPRFVKLNSDAVVLRMDPQSRSDLLVSQVAGRLLAPSEARAIEDRQPYTEAQYTEFDRLFGTTAPETGVPA